jgi:nitroreductase
MDWATFWVIFSQNHLVTLEGLFAYTCFISSWLKIVKDSAVDSQFTKHRVL